MSLQITPDLGWPSLYDMVDDSLNEQLIEIDNGDLTDLGASAPDNYSALYKSSEMRVFLLDLGSGDKYYNVPAADFANLTWKNGKYLYRVDSDTHGISSFTFIMAG